MRIATLSLLATLFVAPAFAIDAPQTSTDIGNAPAGTYVLEKNHASITFKTLHMGFAYYTMRFNDFDAQIQLDPAVPQNSSVTATINPASLDSHNQQLTQHTSAKDFLNIEKFPTITFKSTKIEKIDANHGKIIGDLTMLGVTKPITLNTTFIAGGLHPMMKKYDIGFTANGSFKRSDFGMTEHIPMVGDDIHFIIEAEFVQK